MCGRYVLEVDAQEVLRSYAAHPETDFSWDPVFSISPRTKAPVVREHYDDDDELVRTIEFARWGFKPAWAKEKGPRPINARFETAHTMREWLAPGKLEKDEREHLHGALGEISETIAASLVTYPVDRAVNNVRTLDRTGSGLIAPIKIG